MSEDTLNGGIKRAALALSGLSKSDRNWVLNNLENAERERLATVLAQVEEMGVRVAAPDVDMLFEKPPLPITENVTDVRLTPRQRVARARASEILFTLGNEPDWMVAALCGVARWPWLPEFMGKLGESRAANVRRYMRGQAEQAPALCEAVVQALAKQLAAMPRDFDLEQPLQGSSHLIRSRFAASLSRLSSWLL